MTISAKSRSGAVRFLYRRFYADYEDEYETVNQAMSAAYYGLDQGELYPVKIIDGEHEYDFNDMEKYWEENGVRQLIRKESQDDQNIDQ